jgi:hypothetical protein
MTLWIKRSRERIQSNNAREASGVAGKDKLSRRIERRKWSKNENIQQGYRG